MSAPGPGEREDDQALRRFAETLPFDLDAFQREAIEHLLACKLGHAVGKADSTTL